MASHQTRGYLLLIFLTSIYSSGSYAQEPEVTIEQGTLRGTTLTTRQGRNVSAFLGIPYGKPPTGNLRFANPVAADGWNGTLDVSSDPSMCIQMDNGGEVSGDEDCLFVKVYTPELSQGINSSLLPVMVYIHGGGFFEEMPIYNGPQYLLDEDVVLVTVNYRLGPLGFLSTGDEVASGNWGLKDQVLALEWVQGNIRDFGGDPDRVTLFGESAGAGSAHLLALSDATNGLFHKYITQSGSSLASWAYRPRVAYSSRAFELGEYVGCSNDTSDSLINCLRTVGVLDILETKSKFLVWRSHPVVVWGPTDEPEIEGAILTDSPANLIAAGKFHDLPWMSGIVRDEGLEVTPAFYEDEDLLQEFLDNFDMILPHAMFWTYQSDSGVSWTSAAKAFYFNNDFTSNRSEILANLTILFGDAYFYYPARDALEKQHALSVSPQYFYTFNYEGALSFTYLSTGTTVKYGVAHADDLLYLFPENLHFSHLTETMSEVDYEIVERMVQLWTSFAINGTPSASALGDGKFWEPHSSTDGSYLRIGNGSDTALEIQNSFFPERMQFWAGLKAGDSGTVTFSPNAFILILLPCLISFLSTVTQQIG